LHSHFRQVQLHGLEITDRFTELLAFLNVIERRLRNRHAHRGVAAALKIECFVAVIYDESLRLTRLLDEILDISRLEAGSSALKLEPINANTAVHSAIETVAGITLKADVKVTSELSPDDLPVRANADRLRQVLINILSNAVKYNGAEVPEIVVRTSHDNRTVKIDIIDNGGGVTREEANTVFEKFARGNRSVRSSGAGLGLPISRAIMHAMEGDLTLEFSADHSSYFRLTLPLLKAA